MPNKIKDQGDMSREEQLAINVPELLLEGISNNAGEIRGVVQGVGQTAAALQVREAGMPLEMFGRMLTMLNRHTCQTAATDIDVIVEEPEKRGYPEIAKIVRAGIASCDNDADYLLFARWLANVYGLVALHESVQSMDIQDPRGSETPSE